MRVAITGPGRIGRAALEWGYSAQMLRPAEYLARKTAGVA
jgi:hypothetical protein